MLRRKRGPAIHNSSFRFTVLCVAFDIRSLGRVAQCLFVCVTMPFMPGKRLAIADNDRLTLAQSPLAQSFRAYHIAAPKLLPGVLKCESLDWGIHR
jgi:hypothetical protein